MGTWGGGGDRSQDDVEWDTAIVVMTFVYLFGGLSRFQVNGVEKAKPNTLTFIKHSDVTQQQQLHQKLAVYQRGGVQPLVAVKRFNVVFEGAVRGSAREAVSIPPYDVNEIDVGVRVYELARSFFVQAFAATEREIYSLIFLLSLSQLCDGCSLQFEQVQRVFAV